LDYSRSLADWAERAVVPGVALAWGGGHAPSPLLERVRRVLRPGDRPEVRISWAGLAALLVIGPLLLVALWRGTAVPAALAAQLLSPAERIQSLEDVQARYAPPASTDGKVTLQGTIRRPDGQPLETGIWANSHSRASNGSYSKTLEPLKNAFSVEVPSGV